MPTRPPHDARIQEIFEALGIPDSYPRTCGLTFQPECRNLVETEPDVFGRQPLLEAGTFAAWQAMQAGAGKDGVVLQIVSAYRSAEYQRNLIEKKLAGGQAMADILKVNAAPGYSEHHSGRALDITTPGYAPLEEEFEDSDAFAWLCRYGGEFGFRLSFPRDNPAGICYEPWHWKFTGS